jgi:hypothetical protein
MVSEKNNPASVRFVKEYVGTLVEPSLPLKMLVVDKAEVSVPTEVIAGWAAAVTVVADPARVAVNILVLGLYLGPERSPLKS